MTQNGLWRTAIDLHPEDLQSSILSARAILEHLMGAEIPVVPSEDGPELLDAINAWTEHEHALANYGAILQYRLRMVSPDLAYATDSTWFANTQRVIRAEGWPYSRPRWATDEAVLMGHRQKLVNQRSWYYRPKFGMDTTE